MGFYFLPRHQAIRIHSQVLVNYFYLVKLNMGNNKLYDDHKKNEKNKLKYI